MKHPRKKPAARTKKELTEYEELERRYRASLEASWAREKPVPMTWRTRRSKPRRRGSFK
jgi:hypothetical protein